MNSKLFSHLLELLKLKLKFATSSSLATAVDYGLYIFLVGAYFTPVISNVISAGTGMLINFVIQKKYVFELNRNLKLTFLISLLTSLIGLGIGTGLIYLLNMQPFFADNQYVTKGLVVGLIFFYNFYMKRFAFEKRFI